MKQGNEAQIELHIEELVLHGFPLRDRHEISDYICHELRQLIIDRGLPRSFGRDLALRNLRGNEINLASTMVPANVGAEIARSVYASFGSTSPGRDK
jgi:hypothetical protein